MLNEEVVLVDSDDESPKAIEMDTTTDTTTKTDKDEKESPPEIKSENETNESEEVVVEYNHSDYADLVGPLVPTNAENNQNGGKFAGVLFINIRIMADNNFLQLSTIYNLKSEIENTVTNKQVLITNCFISSKYEVDACVAVVVEYGSAYSIHPLT